MKTNFRTIFLVMCLGLVSAACSPATATPISTASPTVAATTKPIAQTTVVATQTRTAPTVPQASKDVIKIATMSPLSGEQAQLGEGIKFGAQLAIKQLGKPLTDLGFKVELVPQDDQARVDIGTARAKSLVADPDVLVVIGPFNSEVALAASDVFKDADLAMLSPSATNPKLTSRGIAIVNRIAGRDDMQGPAAAHFAVESLGTKKIYIVHDKSALGQSNAESFRDETKKIGGAIAGFDGTDERFNFDAVVNSIKAAAPELVYFTGAYLQAGNLARQLREKGVNTPFLATERIDNPEYPRLAASASTNTYYESMWAGAIAIPETAQFVRDFKSEFDKDAPPFAAQAYDATGIALKALANLTKDVKPSRKSVAQAIRATKDYNGITGAYTFNANGDPLTAKYFFIKVTNPNPQRWEDNPVFKVIELAPQP